MVEAVVVDDELASRFHAVRGAIKEGAELGEEFGGLFESAGDHVELIAEIGQVRGDEGGVVYDVFMNGRIWSTDREGVGDKGGKVLGHTVDDCTAPMNLRGKSTAA